MVVEYTVLTLILGAVYGLVKFMFPEFPVDLETILAFIIWAGAQLGVEVVGQPVREFLARQMPSFFKKAKK